MAYHIEREEVGIKAGKQDHYAAKFGVLTTLNFTRKDGSKSVAHTTRHPE